MIAGNEGDLGDIWFLNLELVLVGIKVTLLLHS